MQIVLLVVIVYILLVFFDLRLVIPYIGFQKDRLPKEIPLEWQQKIAEINENAKTDRDFVEIAYTYLTSKYKGNRTGTLIKWIFAFQNIFKHTSGYLPCTAQNQLLRIMLVYSGRFTDKNIVFKVTVVNFFIHQYILVKVDNEWVAVDLWGKSFGVPFGKSAFLFA